MFVDAYRELAAGKLFWITLLLSGVVVLAFASLGIDKEGVSFLTFRIGFIPFTSDVMPPDLFYKLLFVTFGVPLWLGWVATILALVSTAGIIPSFISGGSIDLSLAKPIGRVRLFLTRYLSGLVFVALQVGVFSVACFLLIGIRGGDWQPRVMLAIPVVLVFFSYLYCVCALLGLVTRSTIAALLITALFWLMIIILNRSDEMLTSIKLQADMVAEQRAERVENAERIAELRLEQMARDGEELPPEDQWAPGIDDELEAANSLLSTLRDQREKAEDTKAELRKWRGIVVAIKAPLPKTVETLNLLDRSLLSAEDYEKLGRGEDDEPNEQPTIFGEDETVDQTELQMRALEHERSKSLVWVLGTSLAFECVVLAICCVIFARRDF